jgi:predicted RNase H-like HicB family nuclease
MNRQWLEEVDKNILYFTPFYEEVRLAEVFHEDDGSWCYSSDLLNVSNEYLSSDSLEEAKKEVEDLIEIYFEDEISYYQSLLNSYKI